MCRYQYLQITTQHTRLLSCLASRTNKPASLTALAQNRLHPQCFYQKRCFWGVDVAFNQVDEERVKLAGPDRAAAEWVLRNGGSIKWTTSAHKLTDYNLLPTTQFEHYKLEEINLTATDVIGLGFAHLKGLKHLKKIIMHGCRTTGDDALAYLHHVQDTLEHMEISRCPMITEQGLKCLPEMKHLQYLLIYDLIEIGNLQAVVDALRRAMPWCTIDTEEPQLSKPSNDVPDSQNN
ncbi:hypothetical protein BsWGS_09970 [Bradybaena similaris]